MPALINGLVVKIAERCNLNCSYCYMYNHADQHYRSRPVFMSREIFRAVASRIRQYCEARPGHSMGVIFHGGEPMLFDPQELDSLITESRDDLHQRVTLIMQTNGTLVSDEWIEVLRKQHIHISVSLDGPEAVHDEFRIDHLGQGSYQKTIAGLRKLAAAGLDPKVLCVINPFRSGVEVYRHFRAEGLRNMNFLFPDVSHDCLLPMFANLGPTPVADYLLPIFDEWMREDDPDVRVRFFIEAIRVLHGAESRTDALGAQLEDYIGVDTDGSILGNDALKVCYDGAPEFGLNVLEHSFDDLSKGSPFLYSLTQDGMALSDQCLACRERSTCGGGHLPNRYSKVNGFRNPSVWCKDLLKIFDYIRTVLGREEGLAQYAPQTVGAG